MNDVQTELLHSLQDFSNELYRTVVDEQRGNFVNAYFSPTSIYLGLFAAFFGSRRSTRNEIYKALHLCINGTDTAILDENRKMLRALLKPVPRCISGSKAQTAEIVGVNRAYFRHGLNMSPYFVSDITKFFGFDTEFLQFNENAENDRQLINHWVNTSMEGNVPEFLPPDSVNNQTMFILANAMYFKGSWARRFNHRNTKPDKFVMLNGKRMTVNMMYQCGNFAVQDLPDGRARALKAYFRDLNWSMLFILPNEQDGLQDALNYVRQPGRLVEILKGTFKNREVHIYLPRFKIHSGVGMNEKKKLAELGISAVFQPDKADFSAVCETPGFCLNQMRHKAIITVDEDGVSGGVDPVFSGEAPGCFPSNEIFKFDHPFFLAVIAQEKVPVFLGHVVEPEAI